MTYKNIPTFSGDAYKSYIRESVLNPMITQHNKMGVDITESKAAIDASKEGIASLNTTVANTSSHVSDLGIRVHELERTSTSRVTHFTDLEDAPRHLECNKFLKVSNDGSRIEFADGPTSAGGSATSFTSLSDTPDTYSGEAGKVVKVNALGNGLIFSDEVVGATSFTDLSDTPSEIPANKMLRSNASGELVFDDIPTGGGSGGVAGAEYFTDLLDVPSAIVPGKMLVGNAGGTALEFVSVPTGGSGGGSGDGSGDGSVDLGPITARVDAVENDVATVEASVTAVESSVADHEGRIATLEVSGGGSGGVSSGLFKDTKHNSVSGKTAYTMADVKNYSCIMGASGSTNTVELPTVVRYDATPDDTQVAGGAHITITSLGPVMTVSAAGSQKIWAHGTSATDFVVGAGQSVTLAAIGTHNSFLHWVAFQDAGFGGGDTTDLETSIADHEARISDLEAGAGGSGGGSVSGPVDITDLKMTFKSEQNTTYTAADVMSTAFLNVRTAGTTIIMPTVKIGGNGTTEAAGGEVRYVCAYEQDVTLAGGDGGANAGGKQNVSWGGSGEVSKVVPKGTTVGLVAVAIDEGSWSNWQVFSEVASRV